MQDRHLPYRPGQLILLIHNGQQEYVLFHSSYDSPFSINKTPILSNPPNSLAD